ncbi:Hydantoinase B/oxoprolinase [Niveomyces insectorum RCEF 264]|uniref:Hydantoinase B/oxoprolinase n=1 Tax=Niveomyces insectorum RCEF 264 TaxID=1081102 RepID=A0A167LVY9_9HYPO|nr:Hydantoinase B/oxoprolinase [Niveomyces insectorum RCEF 264]
MAAGKIRIAIDRGGTFTDAWAQIPGREEHVILKVLSEAPDEYGDAPTECIRQILEIASGASIPRGTLLDLDSVESIRMGTTVATNALLERKGERVAFVTTKGFRDLLRIGNQARPDLFDLSVQRLDELYEAVLEVDERVTIEGWAENPEPTSIDVRADADLREGLTGEAVRILQKPDLAVLRRDLQGLWDQGFRDVAIAFMHSYTYPDHENAVADLAAEMGFTVSASARLLSMVNLVPRSQSAVADAYLSPVTQRYLASFQKGFKGQLEDHNGKKLFLNQSDGGLTNFKTFAGLRGVLSGPAGGLVGVARTCYHPDDATPVLGFDMGGTSTDVARFSGELEHVFESTIAEIAIQTPQLDINTVAAGGGSILSWENGLFKVGPESAGANPGPACYGRGGPLTVTDANLFLGRIIKESFPQPLDSEIVAKRFRALTDTINAEKDGSAALTVEEVACGFLSIANATMTRPIRTLSEGRGFETAGHNLACFGGAGGQHAVFVARDLGIRQALIPRYSSILSAFGMALADVTVENQEPEALVWTDEDPSIAARLDARFQKLCERGAAALASQGGFCDENIVHEMYLNMHYRGSDTTLMIRRPETAVADFGAAFTKRHEQEFGFSQPREILVEDIRVRSVGKSSGVTVSNPFAELKKLKEGTPTPAPTFTEQSRTQVYFENEAWLDTPVYDLATLPVGARIHGPAMIVDKTQTIVVDTQSEARKLPEHVVLEILDVGRRQLAGTDVVDPILLSVFSHRLMSVAEQMGTAMQKTSISVNIKERLDYSCAVFSADGGLVANAPHIPGHLGSMASAIAYQANRYKPGELKPGDVLLSNHPIAGGTHLPDITCITPVFDDDAAPTKILFFVGNRGHHADIGGIIPGSMPPSSTELWQEGAAFESFKMINQGVFDEAGLIDILYHQPAKYPGCSGTRTLKDNIADLKAAVASNQRGIQLIHALVKEYSWPVVEFYMKAIQDNAAQSVRELLKVFSARFEGADLEAVDYTDDGTPLVLRISIDAETGNAVFDFTGTGPEHHGNLNCPPACMYSSILYCLRCMISSDIPLNQGCLQPIEIVCPPGTLLTPSFSAATVGSTGETSNRVIDLIFKAFHAAAASQGTCNNLTFGYGGMEHATGQVVKGFGYYETIAGGAGAGANWDGQSGVHTGVTNTRIGDPEVFEKRYPVILREFSIRHGSGGAGLHRGGDGCVRDIEFRIPVQVSILSERRVNPPYGLAGGCPGARGVNIWVRHDPETGTVRRVGMSGKSSAHMRAGDRFVIHTPGGGGYGRDPAQREPKRPKDAFTVHEKYIRSPALFKARGSIASRQAVAASN